MTGISVFDHKLLADSWSTQEMYKTALQIKVI